MRFELQRADFWKRISAFLFDIIMLVTVAVGIAAGLSAILKVDSYLDKVENIKNEYYEKYNIDINVPEDKLTDEQKQARVDAEKEFSQDKEVIFNSNMHFNLLLITISISVLLSYVALELTIPYALKYGRTLGKKIFGLAVIRTNGVKVSGPVFFVRTIIGKYTMETMVPIYFLTMAIFNVIPLLGPLMTLLLIGLEIFTVAYTKTRSTIHDLVSDTVVVDYNSQMIFESEEELVEYKTRIHAEEAAKKEY